MDIKISKGGKTGILVSFHTEGKKFRSPSERNKFFAGLYGRKQIIKNPSGRYVYRRKGLLDEIPHMKVGDSVFIVAMKQMQPIVDFFEHWEKQVSVKTFPVLLGDKDFKKITGKRRVRIW